MSLAHLDVAILCGGKQTRSAFLGDTPKVLAPIGKTIVAEMILDRLRAVGAKRVTFLAGHLGEQIDEWAKTRAKDGFEISVLREMEQRGVRAALSMLFAVNTDKHFAILWNGDTLVDGDISWLGMVTPSLSFTVKGVPCGLATMKRTDLGVPIAQFDATGILDFIDIGTPEGYALAQERYK